MEKDNKQLKGGELIMSSTDSVSTLLVKSVNFNISDLTMDMECINYYPYFPF